MQLRNKKNRIFAQVLNSFLYFITWPFRIFESKKNIPDNPASFLIVRLDHIGDVILSTPIYHSLKLKFPEAKITVLCGSWAKSVLENNPYIDEIWVLDCPWWTAVRNDVNNAKKFWINLCKIILKIRRAKFSVFIDLRGDIRHIFLFGYLGKIAARIAYTRSGGGFLLSHPLDYPLATHEIKRNQQLLSFFSPIPLFDKTEVYPANRTLESLKEKLDNHLNPDNEHFIIIFNGGRSPLRRLGEAQVLALCQAFWETYQVKCVFVGGKEDKEKVNELKTQLVDNQIVVNLCNELTFGEIKLLIEKSLCFIGTDSSLIHLSGATSTPSIALYGPLNPEENEPLGKNKISIYHPYPCSPCGQQFCVQTQTKHRAACLEVIQVNDILRKFIEFYPNLEENNFVNI